jgi:hypothetical protein
MNSAVYSSDGIATSSTIATIRVSIAISGSFHLWQRICGHESGVEVLLEVEAEDDVRDDEQPVSAEDDVRDDEQPVSAEPRYESPERSQGPAGYENELERFSTATVRSLPILMTNMNAVPTAS